MSQGQHHWAEKTRRIVHLVRGEWAESYIVQNEKKLSEQNIPGGLKNISGKCEGAKPQSSKLHMENSCPCCTRNSQFAFTG